MHLGDTAHDDSMPNALFGYELLGRLGSGAGSRIFAASHPQTRQLCALKHVVVKHEKDARFVDQLEAEFTVGQRVNHAGLRKSIDFKTTKTWLGKVTEAALILELFDGTPLDENPLPSVSAWLDCFIQVGNALHALHKLGYVHCDLKPGNILMGVQNDVKVIDLGQACKIGEKKERIQGTPDFIAPEQVRLEPVTPQTDVFNFGATLYYCLCGKKLPTLYTAGKGENNFLVDGQISKPHELNPLVPLPVSNLIMDCVRTRAAKRPADMADVVGRLEVMQFALSRRNVAVAV